MYYHMNGWTPFSGDMEGTNAQDKSKSVDRHCYKRLCSSMILSKPPGGEWWKLSRTMSNIAPSSTEIKQPFSWNYINNRTPQKVVAQAWIGLKHQRSHSTLRVTHLISNRLLTIYSRIHGASDATYRTIHMSTIDIKVELNMVIWNALKETYIHNKIGCNTNCLTFKTFNLN